MFRIIETWAENGRFSPVKTAQFEDENFIRVDRMLGSDDQIAKGNSDVATAIRFVLRAFEYFREERGSSWFYRLSGDGNDVAVGQTNRPFRPRPRPESDGG
jgi:hypothetical protein